VAGFVVLGEFQPFRANRRQIDRERQPLVPLVITAEHGLGVHICFQAKQDFEMRIPNSF
jgi:hypothetical protein